MILPDPEGMQLHAWADSVVSALNQYSNVINPLPDDDWQAWGMMFLNDPYLTALDPPNPYNFSDWVDWGQRLSDALGNAQGSQPTLMYQKGIIAHPTLFFLSDHQGNILVAH